MLRAGDMTLQERAHDEELADVDVDGEGGEVGAEGGEGFRLGEGASLDEVARWRPGRPS